MENNKPSVFQLSILSQNDQPNTSCDGCDVGAEITATVTAASGCTFLSKSNAIPPYPVSNENMTTSVLLPIPSSTPPPTPTWFFLVNGKIEDIEVNLKVTTPGYPDQPCKILLTGKEIVNWVDANHGGSTPTNQIFQHGNCGIFGYAQKNDKDSDQPIYWIYTITAGVCDPKVHPSN